MTVIRIQSRRKWAWEWFWEIFFSYSKNSVLDFNVFVLVLFLFSISKILDVREQEQVREHVLEQLACSFVPDSHHFRSQYVPPIYPPILANVCLTRLKPFKDAAHARTESERIGNNYSKYAKDLKLTHKKSSTRRNASLRQVFNFLLKTRPLIGWQSHRYLIGWKSVVENLSNFKILRPMPILSKQNRDRRRQYRNETCC